MRVCIRCVCWGYVHFQVLESPTLVGTNRAADFALSSGAPCIVGHHIQHSRPPEKSHTRKTTSGGYLRTLQQMLSNSGFIAKVPRS